MHNRCTLHTSSITVKLSIQKDNNDFRVVWTRSVRVEKKTLLVYQWNALNKTIIQKTKRKKNSGERVHTHESKSDHFGAAISLSARFINNIPLYHIRSNVSIRVYRFRRVSNVTKSIVYWKSILLRVLLLLSVIIIIIIFIIFFFSFHSGPTRLLVRRVPDTIYRICAFSDTRITCTRRYRYPSDGPPPPPTATML